MIFEFRLPLINPHMTEAVIEYLHTAPGSTLKTGDKLLDLSVNLGDSFAQDCPPISYFRIIMRENVFLREFHQASGQSCKVGELVALFSTVADEDKNQPAQRSIRFTTAGIVQHGGM